MKRRVTAKLSKWKQARKKTEDKRFHEWASPEFLALLDVVVHTLDLAGDIADACTMDGQYPMGYTLDSPIGKKLLDIDESFKLLAGSLVADQRNPRFFPPHRVYPYRRVPEHRRSK
jgi:hypothetical protein